MAELVRRLLANSVRRCERDELDWLVLALINILMSHAQHVGLEVASSRAMLLSRAALTVFASGQQTRDWPPNGDSANCVQADGKSR